MQIESPISKVPSVARPHWWLWLGGILLVELLLSYGISANVLTEYSWLHGLVTFTRSFATVVGNFDGMTKYPEALSLYLTITVWLLLPKAAIWYKWLHSSFMDNYRHLVISPLTAMRGDSVTEFATAALNPGQLSQDHIEKPRSLANRILLSLVILVLFTGLIYACLNYGPVNSRDAFLDRTYRGIAAGGLSTWWHWAVTTATPAALFLTIEIAIIKDYCVFLARTANGKEH